MCHCCVADNPHWSLTMKKPLKQPSQVRVIRDCRDAKRDYWLAWATAKQLYEENKLAWDLTNSAYCEKDH